MPKSYEEMTARERVIEYNRLEKVLKKQQAENPRRTQAIAITLNRMRHLHDLHKNN